MANPVSSSDLVAYNANCHCGAVTLTVHIPSLSEHEVVSCNCSICTRNGYLMVYPERKNIVFHTGLDNVTDFSFGNKSGVHRFCKTCGSSVGGEAKIGEREIIAINVRLFQDVDLDKLKLRFADRKNYGAEYEYPHFPDPLATEDSEASLVPYHANCQCSAVIYTVRTPSLSDHTVNQCNCSICDRNGYLLVYPPPKNVIFHQGYDNLATYSFGTGKRVHKFCRTCGSSIFIDKTATGEDEYAMNVRMFKEIDPKELTYTHFDGRNRMKPAYTVGKRNS